MTFFPGMSDPALEFSAYHYFTKKRTTGVFIFSRQPDVELGEAPPARVEINSLNRDLFHRFIGVYWPRMLTWLNRELRNGWYVSLFIGEEVVESTYNITVREPIIEGDEMLLFAHAYAEQKIRVPPMKGGGFKSTRKIFQGNGVTDLLTVFTALQRIITFYPEIRELEHQFAFEEIMEEQQARNPMVTDNYMKQACDILMQPLDVDTFPISLQMDRDNFEDEADRWLEKETGRKVTPKKVMWEDTDDDNSDGELISW